MPQATILVETTLGGGPKVVAAVAGDGRVQRAFATVGRIDDAVWGRFSDQKDLTRLVRAVAAVEGVRAIDVLPEAAE